jgi:hypothetical protein
MIHWTRVKAIDWDLLESRANLAVLTAVEGQIVTRRQMIAGDLQQQR